MLPFILALSPWEKSRIRTFYYFTSEGDTLEKILSIKRIKGKVSKKHLKVVNPKIRDWTKLKSGTKVYIEYFVDINTPLIFPPEVHLKQKLSEKEISPPKKLRKTIPQEAISKKRKLASEEITEDESFKEDNFEFIKASYSLSAFYAFSTGSFTEANSTGGTSINYSQDSPITLGFFLAYRPKKNESYYSGSIYISQLNDVTGNFANRVKLKMNLA